MDFYLRYFFGGWKELLFPKTPIFITFFITSRCNASCEHCLYWNKLNTASEELSIDEISRISQSLGNFPKLLLSGGEPFLREDVNDICRVFYRNNQVRQITIPTNGILSERIRAKTEKILDDCPEAHLQIQLALDGPEAVHNRIRNNGEAFHKTIETFRLLKEIEEIDKNLEINFCFCFSSLNENYIKEVSEYIANLGNHSFHLILVRKPVKNDELLRYDFSKYETWNKHSIQDTLRRDVQIFEKLFALRRRHQMEIIKRVVEDKSYRFKCTAGRLTAVIDESGNLFPCEPSKTCFGNLRTVDYDFNALWQSKTARMFRKKVFTEGCRCTHESNTITNISFAPKVYAQVAKEMITNR